VRTTLDIDEDVLQAARELAEHRKTSIGKILSDGFRGNLFRANKAASIRNGFPVIDRGPDAEILTFKKVNELRDEL
jgi:hypothetical protein